MDLLTPDLRARLRAIAVAHDDALRHNAPEPDPAPVVKLFNPVGAVTLLATEPDGDGDTLFGLADRGFGGSEFGTFSLAEIAGILLPFGRGIERDLMFASVIPLSLWADAAAATGSIGRAEAILADADRRLSAPPVPGVAGSAPSWPTRRHRSRAI